MQFFNHFHEENQKIESGKVDGIALDFDTLGIMNGIIDMAIQAPHYPEFAVHNTYGIKTVRSPIPTALNIQYRMVHVQAGTDTNRSTTPCTTT